MHRVVSHALVLLGLILAAPSVSVAQAEKRIALVIGNAAARRAFDKCE